MLTCSKSMMFVFLTFFFKLSKAFSFFSYLLKEHFFGASLRTILFELSKAFSFYSYLLKEHILEQVWEKPVWKVSIVDFVLRRNQRAILFQSAFKVLLMWQYLSHLILVYCDQKYFRQRLINSSFLSEYRVSLDYLHFY